MIPTMRIVLVSLGLVFSCPALQAQFASAVSASILPPAPEKTTQTSALRKDSGFSLVPAMVPADQPAQHRLPSGLPGFRPVITAPPVEEEPRLKDFHKEFVGNFKALFSMQNLVPLAIGAAATGAALGPNDAVEEYFREKERSSFRNAGNVMGNAFAAGPAVAGLLLLGRKSDDARFRSFTYSLAQGYLLNQTVVTGIKFAASSRRPNGKNSLSFPSGHTSGAFTWATIVDRYYGKKAGIPAYLAATYVGFSRLDDRSHRLTDVVAGAAIGYIVGRTVSRRANPERRFRWNIAVPPGGGVGLSMQYKLFD